MKRKKPADAKAQEQVNDFVAGAGQPTTTPAPSVESTEYPWDEPHVNEKFLQPVSLRVPQPLYLKLKWLAENTPKTSMHRICIDSIEGVVEHEVSAMIKKLAEMEKYQS